MSVVSQQTKEQIACGIATLTTRPYDYQIESAEFLFQKRWAMTADEMGLGKSLQAVTVIASLAVSKPNCKCVVVCPASLKINWSREFVKFAPHISTHVCTKAKDIPKAFSTNVVIINFEQLIKAGHLFRDVDAVICDEAHYLSNSYAKRSRLFRDYVESNCPDYVLLLTGTPIKNRVPELYSLLRILECCYGTPNGVKISKLYKNYNEFCGYFCHEIVKPLPTGQFVKEFVGSKNEGELVEILSDKMIRHTIDEHIKLPPVTKTVLEFEAPPDAAELLKELLEEWEYFLAHKSTKTMSGTKAWSATRKAPFTIERVMQLSECEALPVLIFSDHVASSKVIASALYEKKLRIGLITGETPQASRQGIIDAFQGGKLDVLVATIPTLQAGVTLTRANRIIFNDLPWEPASLEQASKRIHRIGQDRPCFIDVISYTDIDATISKLLLSKIRTIDKILVGVQEK
jgi:SNF2 family DNA or RNA helicase